MLGVKTGVFWLELSEVLKENMETSVELIGDCDNWQFGDTLVEDSTDVGEIGIGNIALALSGDFKLIKDGEVFSLNSQIAGD